ncbi:MAG: anthranilate phosphoribosyltransferase [Acidimicrobiales bacterium]
MGLTFGDLGGWPGVLGRLLSRQDLDSDEAALAFDEVLSGAAAPSQIAAFAAALRTKGETIEEMTGLLRAMRSRVEAVNVPGELVDTCGTGGDRSGTINVSSIAALVVAASGARVCKHGGRASSSRAGSADLFEALGVAIELGPAGVARCIEEAGIGFCYAPRFNAAMRHAAPVRRELGTATIFNFLGPLANPAGARRQLVGVGDPQMAERLLSVMDDSGSSHAMVVHGYDGLDELSTAGPSRVLELRRGPESGDATRLDYDVDAADHGIPRSLPGELSGGDVSLNATLAREVLAGERGARHDFVVWNSAAALVVAGKVPELAGGVELARELVCSGKAAQVLERLVTVSQQARADGLC